MFRKFNRVKDGDKYFIRGSLLNDIFSALERYEKLQVTYPLFMADGPGGKTISIAIPPGSQLIRLTSTASATGTYNGRMQQVSTNTQSDTDDEDLSTWYSDLNTDDDCLVDNVIENKNASGTNILTVGDDSFVIARPTGRFDNTDPSNLLPIFEASKPAQGSMFAVTVSSDGGDDGDKTTPPSYTYTVTTLDGANTLGTTMTPQRPWANGSIADPGTLGSGYFDNSGTFQLYEVLFAYNTGACSS